MATTEVVDTVNAGALSVVLDNQANVSYDQVLATAIPQGTDASSLTTDQWSTLTVNYAGTWSDDAETKAVVKVSFAHSARHQNGGAFIPSVCAWVESLEAAEKKKLNVSFEASAPYVVGDTAPIAALPITIGLTEVDADGQAQSSTEETAQFVLYGTGYIEKY